MGSRLLYRPPTGRENDQGAEALLFSSPIKEASLLRTFLIAPEDGFVAEAWASWVSEVRRRLVPASDGRDTFSAASLARERFCCRLESFAMVETLKFGVGITVIDN